jgi:DNA-binding SARP family transcriptional activator
MDLAGMFLGLFHHVIVVSALDHHTTRTLDNLGHRSSCGRYDSDATCEDVAGMLSTPKTAPLPRARVYLCGRVTFEYGGLALHDGALGGAQSRLLLAFLGMRRTRPASRLETIEALWGYTPPPSVDRSLNAIVSKLRAAVRGAGVPAPHGVATESGTLQLALPDAWFDIEAARTSLDAAEGALRADDRPRAWAAVNVAAVIARQSFLLGEDAPWVVREREALQRTWRRASIVLSLVSTAAGEYQLGIQHATEAYAAEPFDEVACQALMRAHAAAGNRAEALRVFARCRRLFRDELGAEPSDQTTHTFLAILRAKAFA